MQSCFGSRLLNRSIFDGTFLYILRDDINYNTNSEFNVRSQGWLSGAKADRQTDRRPKELGSMDSYVALQTACFMHTIATAIETLI